MKMTKEDFDFQINGNTWGVFTVAQAAARIWIEEKYKHGRIVFINCEWTRRQAGLMPRPVIIVMDVS